MLVDANILLYAVDEASPLHQPALEWMEGALNGERRVALPWQSLHAFVRIVTNPRAMEWPMRPADAWNHVEAWLDSPLVWTPEASHGYRTIFGRLVVELDLRGNLVADAALAAMCIEHGLTMVSADSDFARFDEVTWLNPVAPSR